MILHLLRMRRNVNRNVFNDRKNVSVTTVLNKIVYSFVITNKQIGPIRVKASSMYKMARSK